jgi:hypothetical protein
MKKAITRRMTVLLLALLITTPADAQKSTLAKCHTVKDRIERYTGLRRRGGSAGQMQQWKEQLRASEEQFRRMECKDHRRKLQ